MLKFNIKQFKLIYDRQDMTPGMSMKMYEFKTKVMPILEKMTHYNMMELIFNLKSRSFGNFKYVSHEGWDLTFEYII